MVEGGAEGVTLGAVEHSAVMQARLSLRFLRRAVREASRRQRDFQSGLFLSIHVSVGIL